MRNFKKNVVEKMGSGAARAAPSKQLSQRTRAQGASWPRCLALIAAEQPGRRKILRIRRLERLFIARLQGGSCHGGSGTG